MFNQAVLVNVVGKMWKAISNITPLKPLWNHALMLAPQAILCTDIMFFSFFCLFDCRVMFTALYCFERKTIRTKKKSLGIVLIMINFSLGMSDDYPDCMTLSSNSAPAQLLSMTNHSLKHLQSRGHRSSLTWLRCSQWTKAFAPNLQVFCSGWGLSRALREVCVKSLV